MQISSRFSIALHILACTEIYQDEHRITSEFLAESVQSHPVVIRRIISQLKKTGLLEVGKGTAGARLAKPCEEISLLEVFEAVHAINNNRLFLIHTPFNTADPVGNIMHEVLDPRLLDIQRVLEKKLDKMTMADIVKDLRRALRTKNRKQKSPAQNMT